MTGNIRRTLLALPLLTLALLPLAVAPARAQVVKLATLVPEGSVWDKALRDMGAEWATGTANRVSLRVYPGGVAGDDDPPQVRVGRALADERVAQVNHGAAPLALHDAVTHRRPDTAREGTHEQVADLVGQAAPRQHDGVVQPVDRPVRRVGGIVRQHHIGAVALADHIARDRHRLGIGLGGVRVRGVGGVWMRSGHRSSSSNGACGA